MRETDIYLYADGYKAGKRLYWYERILYVLKLLI